MLIKKNVLRAKRICRGGLVVGFAGMVLHLAIGQSVAAGQRNEKTEKKYNNKQADYLQLVKSYADALLEHGRDTYGQVNSPLFATTLDRRSFKLMNSVPDIEGIRSHDRMISGANPMHDQNLYQVLYALTEITGEKRYAQEADRTLNWFFEHCQSKQTKLMAWGEHIGWDFNTENIIQKQAGTTHEYFRPWVLWDKSYKLAPKACAEFARGVWDHQIADHSTGNFSRHARWDKHGPGQNSEYPRHGGFYIATWAQAYERTREKVFLQAIETLLTYFENRRNPKSGAIPAESAARSKGKLLWPASNLSLAVDLADSAKKVPPELAEKMRDSASKIDHIFLKIKHNLSPQGKGFIKAAHADTLQAHDVRGPELPRYSELWTAGYGRSTDARVANLCLLRFKQTKHHGYKALALNAAKRYLNVEPIAETTLYPGTFGDAIFLMLTTYEITSQAKYLERAEHFAQQAIKFFFDDSCPLPKASSKHEHYEAITRSDTLMMSLLKLWVTKNQPDLKLRLIYNDR